MTAPRTLLVATTLALMVPAVPAAAEMIDLHLDVAYAGGSSEAGGTWNLFARTDEFGLFSLRVPLSGVNGAITNEAPTGRINGSPTTNAGFATFVNVNLGSTRDLFFGQRLTPSGAGQQGVYYGVGTLNNGSPNFPGQPGGTNDIGPNLTTLSNVQGVPWANDSPLWPNGATIASGTFSAGATPSFSSTLGELEGFLLTSLGSASEVGGIAPATDITTLVTTNISVGLAADFNGDGTVDLLDLDSLGANFGAGPGATKAQGDANGDGNVDLLDLDLLGNQFGQSVGSAASIAIPEPATLVSLVTAVLTALSVRRTTPSTLCG